MAAEDAATKDESGIDEPNGGEADAAAKTIQVREESINATTPFLTNNVHIA